MNEHNAQHRAYYRMDTMLPMSYRVLTATEAMTPLPNTADAVFIEHYFPSVLNEIDARLQEKINIIHDKSSLMADALGALNEKLNFILYSLGDKAIKHMLPPMLVNISAGGLAFNSATEIPLNSIIDLIIHLNNNVEPLLIRSQVVKVIPNPDATVMIAVEFIQLTEEVRRQLVYFIQTKELELAKQKRAHTQS